VASEEEKKQQGDGKGFAGLSSMVSDVDATVASTPKQQQREATSSSTQQSSPAARPERQEQPRPTQQTYQAPAQPSGSSSAGKWLFGIAAVIGVVIWLANQSDNKSSSRSTYSPAPSSTAVAPTPAWQPPAAQPQAPSRPVEDQPSIGRNNVLSTAQIRYCLAEKIRLDAAESVINNYIESDVDRFNGYVNDHNSRCGEFRYRQGALESARRDVEPYRSQLQAEGRSRFVRSPSAATRSKTPAQSPQPVRPSPDATVQAAQRRLNELGYDAGAADGLFGNKTRVAIRAFQRDSGYPADGLVTEELLRQLGQVNSINERAAGAATSVPATSRTPHPPSTAPNTDSGKPSLSAASSSEQASIENACNYDRQYRSAGDYYTCLRRELAKLGGHSGKPDLSGASLSERTAIENACNYDRQYRGPGDYYSCLKREIAKLSSQSGKPDLSRASSWEQAAIENACNYDRQYRGPGDYYSCLRRELGKLASNPGKPSLSSVSQSEQTSIENACNYDRQYRGPGDYYGCLRRELSKLGYR
jgi:peptidoglycan hydrolase-like protein with peptidoglycan-binding domain